MNVRARRVLAGLIAIVAVGAVDELLNALGLIGLGPQPGDAPPGEGPIVLLAFVSLLVAGAVLLAAALGRRAWTAWSRLEIALAGAVAAAFLVARFYSYDAYYAPGLRRMSDGGLVAGTWIAILVAVTLAAGILAGRWPRIASAGTTACVWAIALTAAVAGLGH